MHMQIAEMAQRRHDPEDVRKEYIKHISQLGVKWAGTGC